jgi:L,D-transpeptidase ErfK/SrfK
MTTGNTSMTRLSYRLVIALVLWGCVLSVAAFPEQTNPLLGQPTVHEVKKGEFLFKIALQYNCSYPSIRRANALPDASKVEAGTKLVIPSSMILPKHNPDESVVINVPELRLYHFMSDKDIKVYPICIGLITWQTPPGEFEVVNKVTNPTWYMTNDMSAKMHVRKEVVPPGPLNPLGDRWIGISLKHIGIHSTNEPMSIGRALSHGCVRLYPDSAHEFFEAINIKDKGKIVYEPVKVAVWQDNIYLEAHEDVYQLISDYEKRLLKALKNLGLSPENLDETVLQTALSEKRGIPTIIGKVPKR